MGGTAAAVCVLGAAFFDRRMRLDSARTNPEYAASGDPGCRMRRGVDTVADAVAVAVAVAVVVAVVAATTALLAEGGAPTAVAMDRVGSVACVPSRAADIVAGSNV